MIYESQVKNDLSYSLRRYYVDKLYFNSISLFRDGSLILDMGGKKTNKRGMFDIGNYNLNVKYANISTSTEPDYLCDIVSIPVKDNSFDGIILSEVLEHVPDPNKILKEAYRILKPNGKLIATTPFMFHIHNDPYDYARYTDQWYKENLSEIGFCEIFIEKQGLFFSVIANMIKLYVYEQLKQNKLKNKYIRKIVIKFIQWLIKKSLQWDNREFVRNNKVLSGYTTGFGVICKKLEKKGNNKNGFIHVANPQGMSFYEFIQKIDSLLVKREKVYPVRDSSYHNLQHVIEEFTDYLLETKKNFSCNIDNQSIFTFKQLSVHPIFICGNMKSGTSLLQQLLESDSVFVMPGDSHCAGLFLETEYSFQELARYWMKRLINPTGKAPFWFIGKKEHELREFLYFLNFFYNDGKNNIFESVVLAILHAKKINTASLQYWVEKTPHNEAKIDIILKYFPNARFIHILRDPLVNIASLKKLSEYRFNEFDVNIHAATVKNMMELAWENQEKLGKDRYYILKYEALTANVSKHMKDITEFLGVEFSEKMLVPTEGGIPAQSNSMYKEKRTVGKVNNDSINKRWEQELSKREKKSVMSLCYKTAINAGYRYWGNYRISVLTGMFINILLKRFKKNDF